MKKLLFFGSALGFIFLLGNRKNNLQPVPPADEGGNNTDPTDVAPQGPPKGTLSNNGSFNPGNIPVKPTSINTLPKNS